MLQQILAATPLYVWAILAFLVYRGVLAARERDLTPARMLVIPLVMLALALHAIASRFGLLSPAMAAWIVATALAAAIALRRWRAGGARLGAGALPGSVRVPGSWAPLAMMLTIFLVKYVLAVMLAVRPGLAANAIFAATVCSLLGMCNGYFLGQLAHGFAAGRSVARQGRPGADTPARAACADQR